LNFKLVEAPNWSEYREDIFTHYPKSKSVFGRSVLFGIFEEDSKYPHNLQHCSPACPPGHCQVCGKIGVVGAQSIANAMGEVALRVYRAEKITPEILGRYNVEIVANNILRLYVSEPNLASRILSVWVKLLRVRWKEKYNVVIKAIVSLSYGVNEKEGERNGLCFRAANWEYLGKSKGSKKHTKHFDRSEEKDAKPEYVQIMRDGKLRLEDHSKTWYEPVEAKHLWLWKYDRNAKASKGEALVVQSKIPGVQSGEHGVAPDASAPLTSKFRIEIRAGKATMVRIEP